MICYVRCKDTGHCTNNTQIRRIVLTGTAVPRARLFDMDLAAGMVETQGSAGNDGHWVFFVRYACKTGATLKRRDVRVDIVRECLVSNAWHAVPDEFESRGRGKM